MKRLIPISALAVCAALLGVSPAAAKKPTVKNRQIHQQRRIAQGVRSGELTKAETVRLERNAARIHRSIAKDKHDGGVFTPRERLSAQKKLNRQSKAIAKQKHDDDQR